MRIAIFSDIHANLVALQTVLKLVDSLNADALWCLGDTVGYGPEPQACADIIHERADLCLAGNHDLAVVGKLSLQDFIGDARKAVEWQRTVLNSEAMTWLAGLHSLEEREYVTAVHASPRAPVWEYVDGPYVAGVNYSYFDTPLCLVGHSHLAIGWQMREQDGEIHVRTATQIVGQPIEFDFEHRWLFNPGSVGQPRDGDPRSSFALLDTEAMNWTWYRAEYDIDSVEQAITDAGLPAWLGRRLYMGR